MLLAHEIGHALYTPRDEWVAAVESKVAYFLASLHPIT